MANDKDTIFEVDAGQILAKLHLGCKLMFSKIKYYNSGITGKDDATPEKPGDCNFDLSNMKGLYEVACVLEKYYYIRKLTNVEIEKLKSKMIAKEGTSSDDEKFKKLKEELTTKLGQFNDKENLPDMMKLQLKFADDMKKLGFQYLKDYLENFCGKENASKLKEADIVATYVDSPFDYKYDKFAIPEAKNMKLLKALEEKSAKELTNTIDKMSNIEDVKKFLDDKNAIEKALRIDVDDAKVNLSYKTGFTVEIETM